MRQKNPTENIKEEASCPSSNSPGRVVALWNGTEEKSEYEKINEHEKELEEGKVDA